jgi:hypothetical protein
MKVSKQRFGVLQATAVLIVLGLVMASGWFVYSRQNKKAKSPDINTFEQCKAAGYPIAESYPEQCFADDKSFTNPSQRAY